MNIIPDRIDERVAIVGTPRSGNTWLRTMLAKFLGVPTGTYHDPGEIPWAEMSGGFVMQIHWEPTDELVSTLSRSNFRLFTLARHPCDVLLSILQYAQKAEETSRWLAGRGGDESPLRGATPLSEEFRGYALSDRARQLLSLSAKWASIEGCHVLRYEDLVADTVKKMEEVRASLDVPPSYRLEIAVSASRLNAMRSTHTTRSFHFWQGRPGLWHEFVPGRLAEEIAMYHPEAFSLGSYVVSHAADRTIPEALHRWRELQVESEKTQVETLGDELELTRDRLAAYKEIAEQVSETPAVEFVRRHGLGLRSVRVARLMKRLVDVFRP